MLTCTLDFGSTGTGPSSVTWTGLDDLIESTDYVIDTGTDSDDGERKTTLTFSSVDSIDYAGTYTCQFMYSDTESYTETAEVIVRCKFNQILDMSKLNCL